MCSSQARVIQRWSKVITERTTAAACWCYNIKATPQVLFFAGIVTHLDPAAATVLTTLHMYLACVCESHASCWLSDLKKHIERVYIYVIMRHDSASAGDQITIELTTAPLSHRGGCEIAKHLPLPLITISLWKSFDTRAENYCWNKNKGNGVDKTVFYSLFIVHMNILHCWKKYWKNWQNV